MSVAIEFVPLEKHHLPLMHAWFNESHVKQFYSLKDWTFEEIEQKHQVHFENKTKIEPFIALLDGRPFGYIQRYPLKEYPWEGQTFSDDVVRQAAGIDYFIGDKNFLKKGMGQEMVRQFIAAYIAPTYAYCVADPAHDNPASANLLERVGFTFHQDVVTDDAIGHKQAYKLMIITTSIAQYQPLQLREGSG